MKLTIILSLLFSLTVTAQESPIRFQYSNPNQPGTLKVTVYNGSIHVRGVEGRELVVRMESQDAKTKVTDKKAQGLRRLSAGAVLSVVEEDNLAEVHVNDHQTQVNLIIDVPMRSSLKLGTARNGSIVVTGVAGDLELEAHDGDISVKAASGSIQAHAGQGGITATLLKVTSGRALSFSTLHGDVDVTLPGSARAEFRMESQFGEVFTDFDVQLEGNRITGGKRDARGRFEIGLEKALYAKVNGGGPRFDFKSLKGNIYIRKLD